MSFAQLLPDLAEWVRSVGAAFPASVIKANSWMFPVILSTHLMALSALGGCVLLLNLRLMGAGLTGVAPASMERTLRPWLWGAIAVLLVTGLLMASVVAMKLYTRPAFLIKMLALAAALILSAGVIPALARNDGIASMPVKIAAAIGVAIWAAAIAMFATTVGPAPGTFHILCAAWLVAMLCAGPRERLALGATTAVIVVGVGAYTYFVIDLYESYDLFMEVYRWSLRIGAVIVAGFLAWQVLRPAQADPGAPALARLFALVTILAWVTVAASGRWIGLGGG